MKQLSLILVTVAFLAGAYLASLHPTDINWMYFIPVIIGGVIGVVLYKQTLHKAARSGDKLAANKADIEDSLANILKRLEELDGRKDKVPTYDMRFEIDRLFRDDLIRFADARESMQHLFGVQAYADIMSSFAAGERYLNRVWSASTDGYVDEVLTYVSRARDQFAHASEEYHKAMETADLAADKA